MTPDARSMNCTNWTDLWYIHLYSLVCILRAITIHSSSTTSLSDEQQRVHATPSLSQHHVMHAPARRHVSESTIYVGVTRAYQRKNHTTYHTRIYLFRVAGRLWLVLRPDQIWSNATPFRTGARVFNQFWTFYWLSMSLVWVASVSHCARWIHPSRSDSIQRNWSYVVTLHMYIYCCCEKLQLKFLYFVRSYFIPKVS